MSEDENMKEFIELVVNTKQCVIVLANIYKDSLKKFDTTSGKDKSHHADMYGYATLAIDKIDKYFNKKLIEFVEND